MSVAGIDAQFTATNAPRRRDAAWSARDHLLAGAALAQQQHRDRGGRDARELAQLLREARVERGHARQPGRAYRRARGA
jgi:hypothetical protein